VTERGELTLDDVLLWLNDRLGKSVAASLELTPLRHAPHLREQRHCGLIGALLRGADLGEADLRGADLTRADLRGALLIDPDLVDADLTGADLTDAHVSGADLTGAHLRGADLTDAHVNGAKGLPKGSR
jgi:uncharacterized protein YjbI with pentapeptide repeats